MPNAARVFARTVVLSALALATTFAIAMAADRHAQLPTLNDMSPAGLRAAAATSADPQKYLDLLPEGSAEAIHSFVAETRRMGVERRSSVLYVVGPPNVQANNVAGDRIGETQSEISVCVLGDTVVVGWNDSFGFTAGGGTGSRARRCRSQEHRFQALRLRQRADAERQGARRSNRPTGRRRCVGQKIGRASGRERVSAPV
mgnify:CR=1 FL=1